ncbi:putative TRAP transporter-DctQ subunit [Hyphomicrobiales bacterium]|nr:putative TRAP transporter-DctQ subunit [Hyphomicrobiales bacterium]CAH1671590.1 putative TRAP transporter-DctQ subunit [Hyphomicrobiales bacterium]
MGNFEHATLAVARVMNGLAAILGIGILTLVTVSVIMRYGLSAPFRFTEDVVGLCVLGATFLALPLIALEKQDIRVTALTDILPKRTAFIWTLFGYGVVSLFFFLFGRDLWDQMIFSYKLSLRIEASQIPIWPWIGVMLVSIVLVALITVFQVIELIRSRGK